MERFRPWEVAVKPAIETCRTPLAFLVGPEGTWEVVDMDPRTLDGWFYCPGERHYSVIRYIRRSENQVRFWGIAHSAR